MDGSETILVRRMADLDDTCCKHPGRHSPPISQCLSMCNIMHTTAVEYSPALRDGYGIPRRIFTGLLERTAAGLSYMTPLSPNSKRVLAREQQADVIRREALPARWSGGVALSSTPPPPPLFGVECPLPVSTERQTTALQVMSKMLLAGGMGCPSGERQKKLEGLEGWHGEPRVSGAPVAQCPCSRQQGTTANGGPSGVRKGNPVISHRETVQRPPGSQGGKQADPKRQSVEPQLGGMASRNQGCGLCRPPEACFILPRPGSKVNCTVTEALAWMAALQWQACQEA